MSHPWPRLLIGLACAWPALAGAQWDAAAPPAAFRFEQELRVNPFDAAALNNLAVSRAQAGHYGEARELLERALRLSPDSAELQRNLERLTAWESAIDAAPRESLESTRPPPEPPAPWP